MKKRKKMLLIIAIIVVLIGIILVAKIIRTSNQTNKVGEVLTSLECKFYKNVFSKESGFDRDIYVSIPYLPVEKSRGENNQYFYEKMIRAVNSKMNKANFRIIDESKNIIIRVKYDGEKSSYTINGDNNYYQTEKAKLMIKENQVEKLKLNIKSSELKNIIDQDWLKTKSKNILGSVDGTCDGYDYYFDEGYKIKTVNTKVFNFVFTSKYRGEVFDGITTGIDNKKIIQILGEPLYENEDANFIIGYKTENYYVFFCKGEISIYRLEEFNEDSNNKFAKILTELEQKRDYDMFIKGITEIYPDYSQLDRNQNGIKLTYPLRGFSIELVNNKNKMTVYKNYEGKIMENFSLKDLEKGEKLPKGIYVEGTDYVFETELERATKDFMNRNNKSEDGLKVHNNSKLFNVINSNSTFKFFSRNNQNIDSELSDEKITSVFNYNDEIFIFGKSGDGIYEYNATNMNSRKLLSDDGECKLISLENNKLYYDSKYIDL